MRIKSMGCAAADALLLCAEDLQSDRGVVSLQISLPKILSSETEGQGSANPHFWPGLRFHSDAIFILQFPRLSHPCLPT